MTRAERPLTASEAAERLGVSTKALRIYEQRGLIAPDRTQSGWRTYRPDDLARAAQIVALRALGLSLGDVARVFGGDVSCLRTALTEHEARLHGEVQDLQAAIAKLRALRADLEQGGAGIASELLRLIDKPAPPLISFELPWPWGGERFELRGAQRLTYITGPLGSGKTRLAMKLADVLPNARFIALGRKVDDATPPMSPRTQANVEFALEWLASEGAAITDPLRALIIALEDERPSAFVVDLVEQGLCEASQLALIAYLRRRSRDVRPMFMLTRSSAILDLECARPDEAIIYCPANHSPPIAVEPRRSAPGYEAVQMCLASPAVRARTEGVIAVRMSAQAAT